MGHNLDLCKLLDAPSEVECPKCGNKGMSYFDDCDIECGDPNPEPGVWKLDCYCMECQHEWTLEFRVTNQIDFTCVAGCKHTAVFPDDMTGMTQEQICEEITRQTGVPSKFVETGSRKTITEWQPSTMPEGPMTREIVHRAIHIDLRYHEPPKFEVYYSKPCPSCGAEHTIGCHEWCEPRVVPIEVPCDCGAVVVWGREDFERTEPDEDEVVCLGCGMFVERDRWCVGKDADAVQCEECRAVTLTERRGA